MYNYYDNKDFYHSQFVQTNDSMQSFEENQITPPKNDILSNILKDFKIPEINTETLILLGIIYFSIYDDMDLELLIIIGILFLLGI